MEIHGPVRVEQSVSLPAHIFVPEGLGIGRSTESALPKTGIPM